MKVYESARAINGRLVGYGIYFLDREDAEFFGESVIEYSAHYDHLDRCLISERGKFVPVEIKGKAYIENIKAMANECYSLVNDEEEIHMLVTAIRREME